MRPEKKILLPTPGTVQELECIYTVTPSRIRDFLLLSIYSKHVNRRDTHINQHSRQKMIQIKRETHVLINTAQKTVHNNLQHALNNRDTPNLATCFFYKDLEKNTTFLT